MPESCLYPEKAPTTSYRYGCRCERCKATQTKWNAIRLMRYGGVCGTCGTATYNGTTTPPTICRRCQARVLGEINRAKGEVIRREREILWAEGVSVNEMAARVGVCRSSLHAYIGRWRARQHDSFPLRRNVSPAGRQRMSESARRARGATGA